MVINDNTITKNNRFFIQNEWVPFMVRLSIIYYNDNEMYIMKWIDDLYTLCIHCPVTGAMLGLVWDWSPDEKRAHFG